MRPDGFNMQEETWYFTGHLITQLKHFPLLYVRNICERQRGTNTLEIESVFWHIVFYKLNLVFFGAQQQALHQLLCVKGTQPWLD